MKYNKNIKYWERNVTEIWKICTLKIYSTLLRLTVEDPNELEDILLFRFQKTQWVKLSIFPKITYRCNSFSIKIPEEIFGQTDSEIYMEMWSTGIIQMILERKKKLRTNITWFQNNINLH